jgi:hypothetical protein
VIDRSRLQRFAREDVKPAPTRGPEARSRGIADSPEALQAYLERHGIGVQTPKKGADGSTVLILSGCPMNGDHGHGTDTAVIWRPDGIGFECKHAGCAGYSWLDVRAKIDPGAS